MVFLVIIAGLAGSAVGSFTGIVPGIHVNTAAALMTAGQPLFAEIASGLVPSEQMPVLIACCIMSASAAHSFVDFVPSAFIGVPDADESLSVLPGHRLLFEGRGMAAVRAAAVGSAVGAVAALALAVPLQWLMLHGALRVMDGITLSVLVLVSAVICLASRRRALSLALMLFTGVLGYTATGMGLPCSGIMGEGTLLFPLLAGLFGLPPLLDRAPRGRVPPQADDGRDPVGPGPGLRGVLAGVVAGWFPGITATAGATLASAFGAERDPARFISLTASIGTVTSVFAVVTLSVTGSGRSGTAMAVKGVLGDSLGGFCSDAFVLILFSIAITSAIGYAVTIWAGKAMVRVSERVDADRLNGAVLILVVALVPLLTGPFGLAVLAVSAAAGMAPPAMGVGRVCLTGCLIVPSAAAGLLALLRTCHCIYHKGFPLTMEHELGARSTALMLAVVFLATLMDGLDGSIVGVALPDIGKQLSTDTATSSWVSIIYMMVLAGTLVPFARIAADTGVRRVMALGLAVFTISSLSCGVSASFPMLVASRAVQAVGAAMMAAAGPMCCTEHLPRERLAFGLSIVTIGSSVGFAVGPALGGLIVEYATWHWIFLINIPLGIIAAPLMLRAIPPSAERGGRARIDLVGAALLFASISLGTFAVETLSYPDMRSMSGAAGAAFAALMVTFVRWEKARERPLLDVGMFARRDFAAIFACLMMINMSYMAVLYLVPFFGEICHGMSSLEVGSYLFVAAMITAALGMPIGRLSDTRGRRPFCIAAGLTVALAFSMFAIFAEGMEWWIFLLIMIPQGLGWAFVGGPMASRLVEHAGRDRDMASSLTNEAYFIGGATGVALGAMVFTAFSRSDGVDIADVSPGMFLDGFVPAMAMCAALALAVALLSFFVRDEGLDEVSGPPSP